MSGPFKMKGFPAQAGVSPMKSNGDKGKGLKKTLTKEELAEEMMRRKEKNPHTDKSKGYTPISKEKKKPPTKEELNPSLNPNKKKSTRT